MKTIICKHLVLLTLVSGIFSCGKETQSSTQGGGTLKFNVTITPALQSGMNQQTYQSNQFAFFSGVNMYSWSGDTNLGNYTSDELSVTKGQNIPCTIYLYSVYDLICRTVQIDAVLNGKVMKTVTKNMGHNGSLYTYCKDGIQSSVNFIIP
jgi:hypothetical protein